MKINHFGCNVVRHTNMGKSIAADFCGNVRCVSDYFQSDTKTMSAEVLTAGRFTVCTRIGNVFVYLCIVFLTVILLRSVKGKVFYKQL